jgi:p-aminobenzoyl-glutamate transporter AbgT
MAQEAEEFSAYREKLDFQTYIVRQLILIGGLSSKIFESSRANVWQKNALNYYFSVSSLFAAISPYFDDTVIDQRVTIEKAAQDKYRKREEDRKQSKLTKKSKYDDVKDTVEVSNRLLTLIMQSLKDKGLLLQEETYIDQM